MLTRRTQILLDEDRYRRLERRAEVTGASIGAVIREAIDRAFPEGGSDRARAARSLLGSPPMPVEDWESMKRDLVDSMYERDDS
jgi:hypothetical protein